MTNLNSFKAYDVRGRIPDEINESLAYDIGRAFAALVQPRRVAVGHDIRLSSPRAGGRSEAGTYRLRRRTFSISASAARKGRISPLSPSLSTAGSW